MWHRQQSSQNRSLRCQYLMRTIPSTNWHRRGYRWTNPLRPAPMDCHYRKCCRPQPTLQKPNCSQSCDQRHLLQQLRLDQPPVLWNSCDCSNHRCPVSLFARRGREKKDTVQTHRCCKICLKNNNPQTHCLQHGYPWVSAASKARLGNEALETTQRNNEAIRQ